MSWFVGNVEAWVNERVVEHSDTQLSHKAAVARERKALADLDTEREGLFAEYRRLVAKKSKVAHLALEAVERIDSEREKASRSIGQAEARLSEWTVPDLSRSLEFFDGLIALIDGKAPKAPAAADVNKALHAALTGIWLRYDGTLHAELYLRDLRDPDEWDLSPDPIKAARDALAVSSKLSPSAS